MLARRHLRTAAAQCIAEVLALEDPAHAHLMQSVGHALGFAMHPQAARGSRPGIPPACDWLPLAVSCGAPDPCKALHAWRALAAAAQG